MENIFIINWLALIVNILWSMALGMFWYSPKVFFKTWQKAQGITDEDLKSSSVGKAMASGLLANAVTVYALAVAVNVADARTITAGIACGAFISLFFISAAQINNGSFSMTKPVVYLIDGGYRLLMMIVAGAVFAIW